MIFLALAVSVTAWFCSRTILWAAWIGFLFYSTLLSDPSDLSDRSDAKHAWVDAVERMSRKHHYSITTDNISGDGVNFKLGNCRFEKIGCVLNVD